MHLVVCYDIVQNRRRARLLKFMKGYLTRVQKSVFEGDLHEKDFEPMKSRLAKLIDPEIDTVRIYHLCGRCQPATDIVGLGVFVETEEDDIVL